MSFFPSSILYPREAPPDRSLRIELRCFSYEPRDQILSGLLSVLDRCGCWIEQQYAPTPAQMEILFAVHLSDADSLYTELVGAGVEFNAAGHNAMTSLCTMSRHRPASPTVSVRLEMSFMELHEPEMGMVAAGIA